MFKKTLSEVSEFNYLIIIYFVAGPGQASPGSSSSASVSSTVSNTSLMTGSISSLLSKGNEFNEVTDINDSSHSLSQTLSSLTTPVPDSNPLDGGILVEEPYNTEAYNLPNLPSQRRFVDLTYRTSLPNLQPVDENGENLFVQQFDTKKVASKGTLQRMKVKLRPDLHSSLGLELEESETELNQSDTEKLLSTLTESFDLKMRLLLDPHYQSVNSGSHPVVNQQGQTAEAQELIENLSSESVNNDVMAYKGINKKKIDEAKMCCNRPRLGRKLS